MVTKPVVLGLLAAGCVTAAAGGAYVAVRQNDAVRVTSAPTQLAEAAPAKATPSAAAQPVAETEAVVTPPSIPVEAPTPEPAPPVARKAPAPPRAERTPAATVKREAPRTARPTPPASQTPAAQPAISSSDPTLPVERSTPSRETASPAHPPAVAPTPVQPEPIVPEPPPAPARPQFVEVVVPASSVVGLQIETSISSENARLEDRVEGRVTRDVMADGRVAIPAGTRVIGDVIVVERGGKMKDKARLGVRFHTLVLADGNHLPFRTDSIYREGASPGSESARKIGGAAIGGAILGAIIGGAKGAAIGGATGAGAGSAVVMAGDRNAATLPAGSIVTVRLSSPVTVDVEKDL